jgi:AcrR family transcriptional regulator
MIILRAARDFYSERYRRIARLALFCQDLYSDFYRKDWKMSRTGRPREFDRDEALQRAMEIFWSQGYEGATLADLQKAMGGITAPSFYAAFGSKEALFREAVELYHKTHGTPLVKALMEAPTARASIEGLLRAAAGSFCQRGNPRGCLVLLGAINCMPANKGVEEFLREQRSIREKLLRQRLRRGISEGDLPSATDVNALASFFASILDGMAIRARDGAPRKTLNAIVDCAMAAWDHMTAAEVTA